MQGPSSARSEILAAIKVGPGADLILREAMVLAASLQRPLCVVSLVSHARGSGGIRDVHRELSKLLARAQQEVVGVDVCTVVEPLVGPADRRLVALAAERAASMIVIGRRQLPTKQVMHDGGTVAALAASVRVPLLIVPLGPPPRHELGPPG